MRWFLTCVGISVATVLLFPSLGNAHPLSFGVLQIDALSETEFVLQLRYSGDESAPTSASLVFPDACQAGAPSRQPTRNGVRLRVPVRCEDGLVGEFGIADIADDAQVLLHLEDEDPRLLTARHPTINLVDSELGLIPYVRLGIEHIATGFDHLLFVMALALFAWERKSFRALLASITAFTLGHSVTLGASALLSFSLPPRPVEACIALSLIIVALELAHKDRPTLTRERTYLIAGLFGLLHGFGFAGALKELGGYTPLALFGFNVGVELGQLAFVLALAVVALLLARVSKEAPRVFTRALPYPIGILGVFFLLERIAV